MRIPQLIVGHNFGARHASSVDAFTDMWKEYGDSFDLMGSGQSIETADYGAGVKNELGWLPASRTVTLDSRGAHLPFPCGGAETAFRAAAKQAAVPSLISSGRIASGIWLLGASDRPLLNTTDSLLLARVTATTAMSSDAGDDLVAITFRARVPWASLAVTLNEIPTSSISIGGSPSGASLSPFVGNALLIDPAPMTATQTDATIGVGSAVLYDPGGFSAPLLLETLANSSLSGSDALSTVLVMRSAFLVSTVTGSPLDRRAFAWQRPEGQGCDASGDNLPCQRSLIDSIRTLRCGFTTGPLPIDAVNSAWVLDLTLPATNLAPRVVTIDTCDAHGNGPVTTIALYDAPPIAALLTRPFIGGDAIGRGYGKVNPLTGRPSPCTTLSYVGWPGVEMYAVLSGGGYSDPYSATSHAAPVHVSATMACATGLTHTPAASGAVYVNITFGNENIAYPGFSSVYEPAGLENDELRYAGDFFVFVWAPFAFGGSGGGPYLGATGAYYLLDLDQASVIDAYTDPPPEWYAIQEAQGGTTLLDLSANGTFGIYGLTATAVCPSTSVYNSATRMCDACPAHAVAPQATTYAGWGGTASLCACRAGYIAVAATASAPATCTPCEAGTYKRGRAGSCEPCPPGTTSAIAASACYVGVPAAGGDVSLLSGAISTSEATFSSAARLALCDAYAISGWAAGEDGVYIRQHSVAYDDGGALLYMRTAIADATPGSLGSTTLYITGNLFSGAAVATASVLGLDPLPTWIGSTSPDLSGTNAQWAVHADAAPQSWGSEVWSQRGIAFSQATAVCVCPRFASATTGGGLSSGSVGIPCACPAGHGNVNGSSICVPCPMNTYRGFPLSTNNTCDICPTGFATSAPGSSACAPCLFGGCATHCAPGSSGVSGKCVSVNMCTAQPSVQASLAPLSLSALTIAGCTSRYCRQGANGSFACGCSAGSWLDIDGRTCSPCASGSTSSSVVFGASSCAYCQPYYVGADNGTTCACPVGFTLDALGTCAPPQLLQFSRAIGNSSAPGSAYLPLASALAGGIGGGDDLLSAALAGTYAFSPASRTRLRWIRPAFKTPALYFYWDIVRLEWSLSPIDPEAASSQTASDMTQPRTAFIPASAAPVPTGWTLGLDKTLPDMAFPGFNRTANGAIPLGTVAWRVFRPYPHLFSTGIMLNLAAPTPSNSPTSTTTPTSSLSTGATPSATSSAPSSITPPGTLSGSGSASASGTASATASPSITRTSTRSAKETPTRSRSHSSTRSSTGSRTRSRAPSHSHTVSMASTNTRSSSRSPTPTRTGSKSTTTTVKPKAPSATMTPSWSPQ